MATNNNNNGLGKGSGIIRGSGPELNNKGINGALEQANYRRDYANKVYADDGYLKQGLDSLNKQAKYYEKMLKNSEKLSKSQETMYKKRLADVQLLSSTIQTMYDKQEASEDAISKNLKEAHKMRIAQLKEQYKMELENIDKVSDKRKVAQKAVADALADEIKLAQEEMEEIEKAAERAKKSTKSIKEGVSDFTKSLSNTAGELSKIFNLQSLAQNQWLDKANEKYEVINKINSSLGYGLDSGNNAYSRLNESFVQFNNKIDGLFNDQDFKNYMKTSVESGIHSEDMLNEQMRSSLLATKYLGMTNDTQQSMYKYMRLTNNNDAINRYNKMMINLQKEGISVNRDTLNEIIKSNTDADSALVTAGFSAEEIANITDTKNNLAAQIMSTEGLGDEVAAGFNDYINKIQEMMTDTNQWENLSIMTGMNPEDIIQGFHNNPMAIMEALGDNYIDRASSGNKTWDAVLNKEIGNPLTASNVSALQKIRESGGMGSLAEATQENIDKVNNMTNEEAESYVKENAAISDTERWTNKISSNIDKFMNSNETGWLNYSNLATTFFGVAIAGNLASGVASLVDLGKNTFGLFKDGGGFLSKIFGSGGSGAGGTLFKFLGKAGPIAAGVAAVGAGVAAGVALMQNKWDEQDKKKSELANNSEETYLSQGKSSGAAAINAIADQSQAGIHSLDSFGGLSKDTANMLGIKKSWNKSSKKEIADALQEALEQKDWAKYNKIKFYKWKVESSGEIMGKIIPLLTAINLSGLENDDKVMTPLKEAFNVQGLNADTNSIREMVKEWYPNGQSASSIKNSFKRLAEDDIYPVSSTGNFINYDSISDEAIKNGGFGYHKAGLNRVPKDNYRALLHKNEMVLNEEDANNYRTLMSGKSIPLAKDGKGIGGQIGGVEVGDYNSNYVNNHNGLDLYFSTEGTPVGSAVAGTVIDSRDITSPPKGYHGLHSNGYYSYGRVVKVRGDDNGKTYIYAHLKERKVNTGDKVQAGTLLGLSGNTGNTTGPHLHFEVHGAGNNSAAHAKYYTNSIRSASGSAAVGDSSGVSDSSSSSSGTPLQLASAIHANRIIPGIGGEGVDEKESSTNRIVESVNGVSTKIIKYLDELRAEQEDQRRLINAFSASQQTIQ